MSIDQLIDKKVDKRVDEALREITEELKEALLVQPMYLNRKDAAVYLSVSESTIDNYVRWGKLTKYKLGRASKFKREYLYDLLTKL
jgi:excisionase family DNA binding protein